MDLQVDWVGADHLAVVPPDNIIIAACPATMVPIVWARVAPMLQLPCDMSHNETDIESVYARLMAGDSLLTLVSKGTEIVAAITLNVVTFDTGLKALYLPLVSGKYFDQWCDRYFKVVCAIAKDLNCTELRGISVRKGWLRKLRKYGFEEVSTIVRCPLEDK